MSGCNAPKSRFPAGTLTPSTRKFRPLRALRMLLVRSASTVSVALATICATTLLSAGVRTVPRSVASEPSANASARAAARLVFSVEVPRSRYPVLLTESAIADWVPGTHPRSTPASSRAMVNSGPAVVMVSAPLSARVLRFRPTSSSRLPSWKFPCASARSAALNSVVNRSGSSGVSSAVNSSAVGRMSVRLFTMLPATDPATPLAMLVTPAEPTTSTSRMVTAGRKLTGFTDTLTARSWASTAAAIAVRSCASNATAFSPVVADARKSVSAELIASVTAAFRSEPGSLSPRVVSRVATLMVPPLALSRSVSRLSGTWASSVSRVTRGWAPKVFTSAGSTVFTTFCSC